MPSMGLAAMPQAAMGFRIRLGSAPAALAPPPPPPAALPPPAAAPFSADPGAAPARPCRRAESSTALSSGLLRSTRWA